MLANDDHILATSVAGGDGLGTLFDLTGSQTGWSQRVLYRFYGDPDGGEPVGKLASDAAGTIFGATTIGGTDNAGAVFELEKSKTGWRDKVLHSFTAGSDGYLPYAGVTSDGGGHLFGTTLFGGGGKGGCGSESCGTVYEITVKQER